MNTTLQIAPVRKSVVVDTDAARAFEIFTAGINRWWPKDHGIGTAPLVESIIEPRVGGRWFTKHADGSEATVGHVRIWEPGRRVVFSWEISAQWKPDARVQFASEVEVTFTAQGSSRTRVDIEHRDFERMGDADGRTMRAGVDGGWVGILQLYAASVSA